MKKKTENNSGKNSEESKKLQNLKPFKKGESGNPNGRPKGTRNFNVEFENSLRELAKKNNTTSDKLLMQLINKGFEKALNGDHRFFVIYIDRIFGALGSDITLKDMRISDEKLEEINNLFNKIK